MALESEIRRISGVATEIRAGGEGRPLLFLHGGVGFLHHEAFLEALALEHRVVAPAHPGFEASEWPREFRSVDDLAYFHLDLAAELGLEDAVLVGACLGGWLALEMLVRDSSRFARVVLVDALGVKFGDALAREYADLYGVFPAEAERLLFRDPAKGAFDATTLPDVALTAIARNREAFTYFGWKPYMHNPSLRRWLHRIDRPTLVAWGEADGFVRPEHGRKLAQAIPGAAFAAIPDAGHYPSIEAPAALARLIADFAAGKGAEAAA
jgi:pimeloyl-ACP methyl ester carboxylesterase